MTPDAPHTSTPPENPPGQTAPGELSFVRNPEQIALSSHILTVSATLVGVCLTVIGLIRVVERLKEIQTIEDDLLALNALLFLFAAVLAYGALRSRSATSYRRLERGADGFFLLGLCFMGVICCLIAYEVV